MKSNITDEEVKEAVELLTRTFGGCFIPNQVYSPMQQDPKGFSGLAAHDQEKKRRQRAWLEKRMTKMLKELKELRHEKKMEVINEL